MDYDHEPSMFSLIFFPFMLILNLFAWKENKRREIVAEYREEEIARLRKQVEDFQRSKS